MATVFTDGLPVNCAFQYSPPFTSPSSWVWASSVTHFSQDCGGSDAEWFLRLDPKFCASTWASEILSALAPATQVPYERSPSHVEKPRVPGLDDNLSWVLSQQPAFTAVGHPECPAQLSLQIPQAPAVWPHERSQVRMSQVSPVNPVEPWMS